MDLTPGSPLGIALLGLAGIASGFVNTLAGGGSLITLPTLMLLGLPADLANGSNRLCVITQSISGGVGFDRGGRLDRGAVVRLTLPTMLGALFGAMLAARLPVAILEKVLLMTLLAVAVTLVWRPATLAPPAGEQPVPLSSRPIAAVALFFAGAYGGFLQAGVGFLLLACLGGLLRYDLLRANALKVVMVGGFTLVSVIVFAIEGKIVWFPAAVMAVTTILGAQLAVRFALRRGQGAVLKIVFVMVVASCIALLRR